MSICEFDFLIWDEWKTETKKNALIIYALKSVVWDELKIEIGEIPKVIYHVWDKIRIKANKTKGTEVKENKLEVKVNNHNKL